ncbi:MAG: hypothetical protein A3G81_30680 [Betaproteobacteria bacterium RIFCSPLOWO2_12_FULL_65_14]|nr:MAG: hypothetical protein A3G81_30680 [Betaproteobacteria bacterium RIFCSPLOWO2_12_FULL_65_14]
MRDLPPLGRAPLLILGFAALASAAAGGMVRLGIVVAAPPAGIAWHGALMASAFFGTLISLERAVAMGRLWAYAAPLACGTGGVLLLLGHGGAAFALFVAGAALFSAVSFLIYLKQRAVHTAVLALGAAALLAANLVLAAGGALGAAALGWIAFFALTIGGERLELSRIARPPRAARVAFAVLSTALLIAALAAPWATEGAVRAVGILLVALAAWLARYDIATRTVRSSGLTRYIALCLLSGYAWLALGGAILALAGAAGARELWDAALHAVMLGFVFSMVFGHAPVILPAVLRVALPYRPLLYAPLLLLHATLALRVAGDLAGSGALRAWGGAGNVAAIALFILTAAGLAAFRRRV